MIRLTKKLPKYLELAAEYRLKIQSGAYKRGDALPDERTISRISNISRPTVRCAFDVLQNEGLIHKIVGSGMYVGGKEETLTELTTPSSHQVIGLVTPEVLERDELRTIENDVIKQLMDRKGYDPFRISYLYQHDLKNKLMQYRGFLQGLIFIEYTCKNIASNVKYAESQGIPVVLAGLHASLSETSASDVILRDDKPVCMEMVDYLVKKGHRRIAIVINSHGIHLDRIIFTRKYLEKLGITTDYMYIKKLKVSDFNNSTYLFHKTTGTAAAEIILKKRAKPTAVICLNDYIAFSLYKRLAEGGVKCPDNIELFGFDNHLFSDDTDSLGIMLSTTGIDREELAMKAVEMMLNRLKRPDMSRQVEELRYNIIFRDTTRKYINNKREG